MLQETKFTYTWKEIKEFAQSLDDNSTYLFMKCPLKWKSRSIAQNATFYLIVERLRKFLWYTKENTKECILKAIFGVDKIKFFDKTYEVARVRETSKLEMWEFTFLIKASLQFCKSLGFKIEIISREFRNLFDNMK
jgi:hypothetical protein